jgi:excinuclease ABC subunit A
VLKTADWIIDLGPEGGVGGGEVVAEGPPEKIVRNKRSHTGAVLKDLLSAEPREHREVFDPNKVAEEVAKDVNLDDVGDARMPWEIDGRKWHTRDRVGHRGERVRWEGTALDWLIDEIEKLGKGKLSPTDYNHRSRIEMKLPGSQTPWFVHFRTGGTWLLDATFRVPTRAFSAPEVRRLVPLKKLDDCEDLPIYGREPRVNVRSSGRLTEDIRILVNNKKEIATPECREFIKRAFKAYQRLVRKMADDVVTRQPWKVNGKSWHVSQQMLARKNGIQWRGTLIVEFLGRLKKIEPKLQEDWKRKVMVAVDHPEVDGYWCRLVTNHAQAMRVSIRTRRGQFTPAMIERLGMEPQIRNVQGSDLVEFWLRKLDQCDLEQLRELVTESIAELKKESAS